MPCAVWATADLPAPCLMEGRESRSKQGSKGCASCAVGVRPAAWRSCCGRLRRGEVYCCSRVLCRLGDVGADLLSAGRVWPPSLAHRHVKDVDGDGMGLSTHTCIWAPSRMHKQCCTPSAPWMPVFSAAALRIACSCTLPWCEREVT